MFIQEKYVLAIILPRLPLKKKQNKLQKHKQEGLNWPLTAK